MMPDIVFIDEETLTTEEWEELAEDDEDDEG